MNSELLDSVIKKVIDELRYIMRIKYIGLVEFKLHFYDGKLKKFTKCREEDIPIHK